MEARPSTERHLTPHTSHLTALGPADAAVRAVCCSLAQNLIFRFLQNVRRRSHCCRCARIVLPRCPAAAGRQACACIALTVVPSRARRPQKTRIQVWLYENTDLRIEGRIIVRFASTDRTSRHALARDQPAAGRPAPAPSHTGGAWPVYTCAVIGRALTST